MSELSEMTPEELVEALNCWPSDDPNWQPYEIREAEILRRLRRERAMTDKSTEFRDHGEKMTADPRNTYGAYYAALRILSAASESEAK